MEESIFLLLQINDAAFPIGGYTQSYGLETYIQKELVIDENTALEYIRNNLRINFLYNDFLAASLAYDYGQIKDTKQLINLEKLLKASKSPQEIRNASLKLGGRFVKSVKSMVLDSLDCFFDTYTQAVSATGINHATAFGVFCAAAGVSKEMTLKAYAFQTASSLVGNCVKTIPLSQSSGQKILSSIHTDLNILYKLVITLKPEDLVFSMPGYDIRCMQHETLYSRLYMS